jgi:biotin-dependent carboxylase-like uncharacterized protein
MSLEIISSSFLALIQDFGRFGLQKYGITNGGPVDEHAYLWANYLLRNNYKAPQLEVSMGAFSARFTKKTMIAVCGADLSITLNDQPLTLWKSHVVYAGDVIKFVSPKTGLRSYLAIAGGFQVDPQLTSCATVIREGLGGLSKDGGKLATGDKVSYKETKEEVGRSVPAKFIPSYEQKISLRFMPNVSANGCDTASVQQFTEQTFKVTPKMDRMGYKLSGNPIKTSNTGIISQGISIGTIQLPKDGQPIVLMRDRQTMGGYPQIGCVAYLDIALLAQSMPGTEIKFIATDMKTLEPELTAYKNFFHLDN